MNDYTPGPWEVRPDMSVEDTETGTTIAAFCEEANARLIAAAPDLLAALEAVMQHFDPWSMPESASQPMRAYEDARAAIAKALGE